MPEPPVGVPRDSSQGNEDATATTDPDTALSSAIPPDEHDDGDTLPALCERSHARVQAFLQADSSSDAALGRAQEQSRRSLAVIEEALEEYGPHELSLSYNGGKDCLVLLILYLAALHSHASRPCPSNPFAIPRTLPTVYIVSMNSFAAVDEFVRTSVRTYHLELARYMKPTMKEAFADYLAEHPRVRAIFVGTRRTDPHGADLRPFHPTDRGWPAFMRVHPVIDWRYADIWTFIRHLRIAYCPLYDLGYTSLGGTTDTHPNPALRGSGRRVGDSSAEEEDWFRPAYELVSDDDERLGRDR